MKEKSFLLDLYFIHRVYVLQYITFNILDFECLLLGENKWGISSWKGIKFDAWFFIWIFFILFKEKKLFLWPECETPKIKTLPLPVKPLSTQTTKTHAEKARSYETREPWIEQCCLWGIKKKGEEKSYRFVHPSKGSINIHPHLNHREGMGT